jgi:hypothetical protein
MIQSPDQDTDKEVKKSTMESKPEEKTKGTEVMADEAEGGDDGDDEDYSSIEEYFLDCARYGYLALT